MSSRWLQAAVAAASFLLVHIHAQTVPECQGTMINCGEEGAGDDPCSISTACTKTFHTCPTKGAFRQCGMGRGQCAAEGACNIRCWGRRVGYASCAEVPVDSCQDAFAVDASGNGMHCMLKSKSECGDRLSCFPPPQPVQTA
ncbi:unnamed protein product [Effrenium voratum]|uniref:Uncharacterized protein n=1 Tax=Effrenium voratum TaxID=2562239 RepID=A0AA36ITG9_9DINO|nr:unnamed protein product [Effrenium voratum]|mmetsp:Transcript_126583/g.300678  ORF Transcript_126583/g.300678 Transcript_126583/m.300678 type:complete len:142 (+) Transcript_126583:82-507(+)